MSDATERYEPYSVRLARESQKLPDIFTYDTIPLSLRNQSIHLYTRLLGSQKDYVSDALAANQHRNSRYVKRIYDKIVSDLLMHFGTRTIANLRGEPLDSSYNHLSKRLEDEQDASKVLDIIEIVFRNGLAAYSSKAPPTPVETVDRITMGDAIKELNYRFGMAGVGYQFENGYIVRTDSKVLHQQVVRPTLYLLSNSIYKHANEEFIKALNHHRRGEESAAMNEAVKALESTLKVICDTHAWTYGKGTMGPLVDACMKNNLLPNYWEEYFKHIEPLLVFLGTPRNNESGHGAGTEDKNVSAHLSAYTLHSVASAIVFLVEAEKELSKNSK